MNFSVDILDAAKTDIRNAFDWYEQKQPGLGKRFIQAVRAKFRYIQHNPFAAPMRYGEMRCAVIDVFPYMVHFTVDEHHHRVIVAAVFHTALNPSKWENKSIGGE